MRKTGSTDNPRSPRITTKLLQDLKPILRSYEKGDTTLSLDNESLKAQLRAAGHSQVTGGPIDEAFKILQQERLIQFRRGPIGFWDIHWISPAI